VAGAINWDINLFVERGFQKLARRFRLRKSRVYPGGKAANVAVASARILSPGQTILIGCLGKDSIAEQQIEILRSEGVVVSGIKFSEDVESGQAYIIIDKDGRLTSASHITVFVCFFAREAALSIVSNGGSIKIII